MSAGESVSGMMVMVMLSVGMGFAQTVSNRAETVGVAAGQDGAGASFSYTRVVRERTAGYDRYDVAFPSPVTSAYPPNNTVPGELYLPVGLGADAGAPAVVCLHILNGNYELERLICRTLAQRGVVALFFKLPYYDERGGEAGRRHMAESVDAFIEGFEQGFADARRALDLLQALPGVNPGRLGITGISLGAIEAAIVSGRDDRVAKAYLTLGGGGLVDIVRQARETRRMRDIIARFPSTEQARAWAYLDRIDPVNAAPALRRLAAAGRLRLVCADQDQVISPAAGRRLAEAAGFTEGVTWLKGYDHYSALARFPQILDELTAFFGADVPATWTPPSAEDGAPTPMRLLGSFLQGIAAFAGGGAPLEVGSHLVGAEIEFIRNGRKEKARVDFARGPAGRFRLTGDIPQVGSFGMGQGDVPWLQGANETVFCGEEEPEVGAVLSTFISPNQRMRYQVAVGALTAAALAPEALAGYFTLTEKPVVGGRRTLLLNMARKTSGSLEMTFAPDGTPVAVAWDIGGTTGTATFNYWRLDTVMDAAAYEAPPAGTRHIVRQEDLLRMFAAAAEYLLEMTE
jgi:hypothetical protein